MKSLFRMLLGLGLAIALPACSAGEMLFVRSLGADMPVLMRGNAQSDQVVVFVHGGPGETAIPQHTMQAFRTLEQGVGVAYWDQRAAGNAQGDPAPQSLTLSQYVKDLDMVVEVVRQRRPGARVYLMTHSWGGAIGADYLADPARQSKIAGWIPVDASISIPECNRLSREWAIQRAEEKAEASEDPLWREMLAWYAQHPAIGAGQLLQHLAYAERLGAYRPFPEAAEKVDVPRVVFFSPHSVPTAEGNFLYTAQSFSLEEMATLELRDRLNTITVPTLVLNGRHDGVVPAATAEELHQRLGTPAADKSLVIFERSGHHPMAEEAEPFARAVLDFLRGVERPERE